MDGTSAEQVPFPRFYATSENLSTSSRDTLKSTTNTDNGVADVVPQEDILVRCFAFVKRIGVNMIMPPYTIDEGMSSIIARKYGHTNLVSRYPTRWLADAYIFVQNASVTKLPLV